MPAFRLALARPPSHDDSMGEGARIALIGFGEAGNAFAGALVAASSHVGAFDLKTNGDATRNAKLAEYHRAGIAGYDSVADAVISSTLILSLVTADQALAAARSVAGHIPPGALFCDMNSVAPETKRQAAMAIERAGGRYADVAVMAPVDPAGTGVPLLVSGPHAPPAARALGAAGFFNASVVEGPIGAAAAIKMIRSVMIKGVEALSAECFLAAERAGVAAEVLASLEASWPGADWARRADYNLDRMLVHGLRRAAEMEQVEETLTGFGIDGAMTRGTIAWQRAIGAIGKEPPDGLAAKARLILDGKAEAA
jgi:3-hydroxyisobutyrate dehydrogenase-like beta-hydroxyacid dehydrogenase